MYDKFFISIILKTKKITRLILWGFGVLGFEPSIDKPLKG